MDPMVFIEVTILELPIVFSINVLIYISISNLPFFTNYCQLKKIRKLEWQAFVS